MRQNWTDEERARLIELRGEGKTPTQIARAMDRPLSSVKGRLRRIGAIDLRWKWTPAMNATLTELWNSGYSVLDIVERMGIARRTVQRRASILGLRRKKSAKRPAPRAVPEIKREQPIEMEVAFLTPTATLTDLHPGYGQCRWPFVEGGVTTYCGRPASFEHRPPAYCEAHARIAYQPLPKRRGTPWHSGLRATSG